MRAYRVCAGCRRAGRPPASRRISRCSPRRPAPADALRRPPGTRGRPHPGPHRRGSARAAVTRPVLSSSGRGTRWRTRRRCLRFPPPSLVVRKVHGHLHLRSPSALFRTKGTARGGSGLNPKCHPLSETLHTLLPRVITETYHPANSISGYTWTNYPVLHFTIDSSVFHTNNGTPFISFWPHYLGKIVSKDCGHISFESQ